MSVDNDLQEAMGESATENAASAPKIKPTRRRGKVGVDNPAAKPTDRAGNPTQLHSGDACPSCDHGHIKVVRTEVKRSQNARVRIWGCGDRKCGVTVRIEVTPISVARVRDKVPAPKIGSKWWDDTTEI